MPDDTDLFLDLKLGPKFVKSPLAILGNPENPIQTGLDPPIYRDPEGNPIITEPLERHENLMNWFGDSKVVDEGGKPLVVYHGGRSDPKNWPNARRFKGESGGMFFTPSLKTAQIYAGETQSIKYDPKTEGYASYDDYLTGGNIAPVYLSIKNPLYSDVKLTHGDTSKEALLVLEAKKKGHDGIIYTRDGEPFNYQVFKLQQIKSKHNRGTFNPEDPDIMAKRTKKGKSLRIKA